MFLQVPGGTVVSIKTRHPSFALEKTLRSASANPERATRGISSLGSISRLISTIMMAAEEYTPSSVVADKLPLLCARFVASAKQGSPHLKGNSP